MDDESTPATSSSPVDIAIVNYNTCATLRDCLEAVTDIDRVGVVRVADNGSTDGSIDMLRTEFPDVVVLSLPHNPGFGGAANELIRSSSTSTVILLNADVRLDHEAIDALAACLDDNADAAIVGPSIRDATGRPQVSCFADPTVAGLLRAESGLHRWSRSSKPAPSNDSVGSAPSVSWVLGAVMAIRRQAFDAVGGFDPGFFLYFEETDLCLRLRRAGWSIRYEPTADAVHVGGASTRHDIVGAQQALYLSLHRYHSRHRSARPLALRGAVIAIMAARLLRDGTIARFAPGSARRDRARDGSTAWAAVLRDAIRGWSPVESVGDIEHDAAARLDWLALLPDFDPEPEVVVLGELAAAEERALCRHFGVERLHRRLRTDLDADVLIALRIRSGGVAPVLERLAPGGLAYLQVESATTLGAFFSAVRVRRQFAKHGAAPLSVHWVVPHFARPRRYVPLEHAAPVRWYLDRLFIASGPAQRSARRVLRSLPGAASIIARTRAYVVKLPNEHDDRPVAAVWPTPTPVSMASTVAAARAIGVDVAPDSSLLAVTSGNDSGSRVVLLTFPPDSIVPTVAVKVSGRPEMNETTRREFATLVRLQEQLPDSLRPTVPMPIGEFTWNSRACSVESAVDGPTLAVHLTEARHRSTQIDRLQQVAAWITELHVRSAETVVWDEALHEHWISVSFGAYITEFDPSSDVRATLVDLELRSTVLFGRRLPLVLRHFDLGPWNVIVEDTGLRFIDWETSDNRPDDGRGLPYCDLDYFARYWRHIVDETTNRNGRERDEAPDFFDAQRTIRSTLDRYRRDVGLDEEFVPIIAVYNWIEHALNGVGRLRRFGDARTTTDAATQQVDRVCRSIRNEH